MRGLFRLVLLVIGIGLGFLASEWFGRWQAKAGLRTTATVVQAVQSLARLESVQMQMQQVIDLRDKQERLFGLLESEDAILLIASGRVSAGVDLANLGPDAILVDPLLRKVRVTLPPAAIFSVALDSDQTFVHSRSTDLLAVRNEQLEAQARGRAEELFREAALKSQVLLHAQRNAESTLRALLTSLGFERVEFETGPAT